MAQAGFTPSGATCSAALAMPGSGAASGPVTILPELTGLSSPAGSSPRAYVITGRGCLLSTDLLLLGIPNYSTVLGTGVPKGRASLGV